MTKRPVTVLDISMYGRGFQLAMQNQCININVTFYDERDMDTHSACDS